MRDLTVFKTLVRERCGLSFEGQVEDKLAQAVKTRMAAHGLARSADYAARLRADAAEFQTFVNLLTINETYFFRESDQLRLLAERLAPRLLDHRATPGPLRILSAGCASGEEPYSIVMSLWERYGAQTPELFEVIGADLDSAILDKARRGSYSEFSFRGVAPELRQRYFDRDGAGYLLKDWIRRQVRFQTFNLLAPEAPETLRDCDIILYRNVSIYFDVPTRKRMQRNLAALLKPDGILMIGTSETLANDLGILPLAEEAGLFYFIKGDPPLVQPLPPAATPALDRFPPELPPLPEWPASSEAPADHPAPTPALSAAAPERPEARPASDTRIAAAIAEHRFDDALDDIAGRLAAHPDDVPARLLKAGILIERRDFAGAAALAQAVLRADDWSADALLLLGLAARWQGDTATAIGHFKQLVYAHPECWPAHYHLGELYRAQGELTLARRAWQTVQRLLTAARAPETGIRVIALELPPQKIRFLCEHQLARTLEPASQLQPTRRL